MNKSRQYVLWTGFTLFLVISLTYWRFNIIWQGSWAELFENPDNLPIPLAAVQVSLLPQMSVALLAGGILGLVSIALQQIVHNTLASDSTLAVTSGAQLALMLVTLFFPTAGLFGSFTIAFIGALLSIGLVLLIAASSKMNPLMLILGGLIVNILFGAIAAVIIIFYTDMVQGIMIWGSGSLVQDGWEIVKSLLIPTALFLLILFVLQRPLTLMALDEQQAKRLGLSVNLIRYTVLITSAAITAYLVSKVGVISFIGLAAASIVNVLHVRHIIWRFVFAFIAGSLLLFITDNLLAIFEIYLQLPLPTGSFTAVFGAPLMIWLVLQQRKTQLSVKESQSSHRPLKRLENHRITKLLAVLFVILAIGMQIYVNSPSGWHFNLDSMMIEIYRYPRTLSAAATGAMLAAGGVLLQTLTRNPMASPEVLGISSGASLAVIATFLFIPTADAFMMLGAGTLGSLLVLIAILWLARFLPPAYILLTGIAIGALSTGVLSLLQVSGNPYLQAAMTWLSGTTYNAKPTTAWLLISLAVILFIASYILIKPLKLLSLGQGIARTLGLSIKKSERLILLLVALMSTGATLAIGPLSFIGLMTPHLARSLGAITLEKQLPIAVLLGMLLMIFADWVGRYVIFPYEISAGTISALIGGIYFLWKIKKN